VIGCEDRLRNDLCCVEWGVKLYSNQTKPTESNSERILKIGQYVVKLWARVRCLVFLTHGVVTFPATGRHHPLAGTKFYCLVTEAHVCEQLAPKVVTNSAMYPHLTTKNHLQKHARTHTHTFDGPFLGLPR